MIKNAIKLWEMTKSFLIDLTAGKLVFNYFSVQLLVAVGSHLLSLSWLEAMDLSFLGRINRLQVGGRWNGSSQQMA